MPLKSKAKLSKNQTRLLFELLAIHIGVKFSYWEACIFFQTKPLKFRRVEQCYTFIERTTKNPKQCAMFTKRKFNKTRSAKSNMYLTEKLLSITPYFFAPLKRQKLIAICHSVKKLMQLSEKYFNISFKRAISSAVSLNKRKLQRQNRNQAKQDGFGYIHFAVIILQI